MAISYVGFSRSNNTVNRPAGTATGDFLIMVAFTVSANALPVIPFAWIGRSEGVWCTTAFGSAAGRYFIAWRTISDIDTEPTSYTVENAGTGTINLGVYAYRGVDVDTPFSSTSDSFAGAVRNSGSPGSTTALSITTEHDNALLLAIELANTGGAVPIPGMTNRGVNPPRVLDEIIPVAGDTGSRTLSWTDSSYRTLYLTALRPAPPPPPVIELSATFTGTSGFTASATRHVRLNSAATFSARSSFTGAAKASVRTSATFAAHSVLTAATRMALPAAAMFTGTSGMDAATRATMAARARFDAASGFEAFIPRLRPVPRFGGLAWSVPLTGDIAMHVAPSDTGIAVHRDIPTDTIVTLHEPGASGIRVIQKVEDF